MSVTAKPFELLVELAARSIKHAAGLPAQEEAVELWNGIGFTVAQIHFVAGMGSISEILHLPKFTAIPGVRSWILGVANVRGRLLPIMDLARYFGITQTGAKSRDKRVLVVEQDDILSGFVVDSVLGMQYFSAESFIAGAERRLPASVQSCVSGKYIKNDTDWHVFDTFELIENDRFLDVAMR
jgi:twitching motility protein PilI